MFDYYKNYVPAKIPKEEDNLYDSEECEIIVLTKDDSTGGGRVGKQKFWTASTSILCSYDVNSGRLYGCGGSITWVLTDEEEEKRVYFKRFKNLTAYRITARKHKECNGEKKPICLYYLIKVLEENVKFESFDEILTEYKREVKINNEILGELVLNKRFEQFNGRTDWCGKSIDIDISVDLEDEDSWDEVIGITAEIVKNQAEWDKKARKFAAEKLTELANDWKYDSYDEDEEDNFQEITEEEFAECIRMGTLSVDDEGDFTFWFDDDDMFGGHSVTVYGNIENGFDDANIEG